MIIIQLQEHSNSCDDHGNCADEDHDNSYDHYYDHNSNDHNYDDNSNDQNDHDYSFFDGNHFSCRSEAAQATSSSSASQ